MFFEKDGKVLVDGCIQKIRFDGENALISLKDVPYTIVFSNKKTKRADHVRKLKLDVGDNVIAVGEWEQNSHSCLFGYDINRKGRMSIGDNCLIRGIAEDVHPMSHSCRVRIKSIDDKKFIVDVPVMCGNVHIKNGDTITCFCMSYKVHTCQIPCGKWGRGMCDHCNIAEAKKRYRALSVSVTKKKEEEAA